MKKNRAGRALPKSCAVFVVFAEEYLAVTARNYLKYST